MDVEDNPEAKPITSGQGRVTFLNLIFTYGNGRNALDDISFTVEPGTSTAIVGESGSGKSTILRLLYRFYNPTRGTYLVDDVNTQEITVDSLRTHIGVVPKDTILFNETIMYNLLYARLEATEEEVFDACRAANIHEKILSFLDGYHTVVGERGLKLSGGEKQRVSILNCLRCQIFHVRAYYILGSYRTSVLEESSDFIT
jgi:ABC-type multidrug transport system fused ATPase/permease subunit